MCLCSKLLCVSAGPIGEGREGDAEDDDRDAARDTRRAERDEERAAKREDRDEERAEKEAARDKERAEKDKLKEAERCVDLDTFLQSRKLKARHSSMLGVSGLNRWTSPWPQNAHFPLFVSVWGGIELLYMCGVQNI